jgi:NAD(P)-dependent dehydrogenase (short-subunit alcohol dehydrogenase family)
METSIDRDLTGRIALVTGATTGIGKEIARGLARLGATVVIGARDRARGDAAVDDIAASGARGQALAMRVDLADQASIRTFAAALAERFDRLDVLVNNAGAWFTDRRESPDGHELTFATNVLGPFLLTELLLDRLHAAGRARVVNVVSSIAAHYDESDLAWSRRPYSGFKVYAQSKQALRMLTWGLAARAQGTGVTANAGAPGFVRTEFNRHAKGFMGAMIGLSARVMATSPQRGADTLLWLAAAPELDGVTGKYFERRAEKDGKFRATGPIAELERICREWTRPAAAPIVPVAGASATSAAAPATS